GSEENSDGNSRSILELRKRGALKASLQVSATYFRLPIFDCRMEERTREGRHPNFGTSRFPIRKSAIGNRQSAIENKSLAPAQNSRQFSSTFCRSFCMRLISSARPWLERVLFSVVA